MFPLVANSIKSNQRKRKVIKKNVPPDVAAIKYLLECEGGFEKNVSEMTEGHGDRLGDLTDDIHGCHNDNGFGKALEPAKEAVVLDIIEPHEH